MEGWETYKWGKSIVGGPLKSLKGNEGLRFVWVRKSLGLEMFLQAAEESAHTKYEVVSTCGCLLLDDAFSFTQLFHKPAFLLHWGPPSFWVLIVASPTPLPTDHNDPDRTSQKGTQAVRVCDRGGSFKEQAGVCRPGCSSPAKVPGAFAC